MPAAAGARSDVPVPAAIPVLPNLHVTPRLRTFSSPVVRRLAKEHGVDITRISGTGLSGRVTRRDVEAFAARGRSTSQTRQLEFAEGADTLVEKMSIMRRRIADHMVASLKTSAHIYSDL